MKVFLLLIIAVVFTTTISAQNSWTVQWDKKVLLKATKEDTAANVVGIKSNTKSNILITYNEKKRKDWSRYLMVYDNADSELLHKESKVVTISAELIKRWAKATTQIKIFTIPRNLNPAIAIKMRRVHLCTLKFI